MLWTSFLQISYLNLWQSCYISPKVWNFGALLFHLSAQPLLFCVLTMSSVSLCSCFLFPRPSPPADLSFNKQQVLNGCWDLTCVILCLDPWSQCLAHNWCSGGIYWMDIRESQSSLSCWDVSVVLVGREKLSWDPGPVWILKTSLKPTSSSASGLGIHLSPVLLNKPNVDMYDDSWTATAFNSLVSIWSNKWRYESSGSWRLRSCRWMSREVLCLRSLIFKSSHSLLSFCSQFSESPLPLGEFKLVLLLLKIIDKP